MPNLGRSTMNSTIETSRRAPRPQFSPSYIQLRLPVHRSLGHAALQPLGRGDRVDHHREVEGGGAHLHPLGSEICLGRGLWVWVWVWVWLELRLGLGLGLGLESSPP